MIEFDHIAIGAGTLQAGVDWLQSETNINIPVGGEHPKMGTHNHVMSTGDDVYIEVIANNPNAPQPERPRWFGMDDPRVELSLYKAPRVFAWVCRTNNVTRMLNLLKDLGNETDLGTATDMQRGDLHWKIALRKDGLVPLWGSAPLLIEWPNGPHPSQNMADLGMRFASLNIETPHSSALSSLLWMLDFNDNRVTIAQSGEQLTTMTAAYDLPDGRRVHLSART
jgi:hypothetical protein